MRIFFCLLALTLASPAMAAFDGPTTATSGSALTTAAEVQKLSDDARITLEGKITHKVANDHEDYMFTDASGTVVVEIDNHVFANRTITPSQTVRLQGEVDTHRNRAASVDVKVLELVK